MLGPHNRPRWPYDDALQAQPRSLAAAGAMRQDATAALHGHAPGVAAVGPAMAPRSMLPPPAERSPSPFAPRPGSLAAAAYAAQMAARPLPDDLQEPMAKPEDQARRKRPDFGFGTTG